MLISTTLTGAVTEALLTCEPTPLASALKLIVTELLGGSVSVEVRREEDVVVAVTVPPAAPLVLISVTPLRPEGKTSLTTALVAVLGPELETIRVKTVVWLSAKVVGLADLLIDKSTCPPIVTWAVPVLLLGFGSVTPAGAAMLALLIT